MWVEVYWDNQLLKEAGLATEDSACRDDGLGNGGLHVRFRFLRYNEGGRVVLGQWETHF